MIISASYKTDIPTFYGEWFMNRLRAGFCKMVNPYGRQVYSINLRQEPVDGRDGVDGVVFWTKNIGPLMMHLPEICDRGYSFAVQHTITGYPRELEARVIDYDRAIEHMHYLEGAYPGTRIIWRYDPILITSLTPVQWHADNFGRLATKLKGTTNEVVVSIAQVYKKTQRNVDQAALEQGFDWHDHGYFAGDAGIGRARALIGSLADIAVSCGMQVRMCSQERYLIEGKVEAARCIDASWFGQPYTKHGNRAECACSASRDIGEYDTCPHGCIYCYAVQNRAKALARYKRHDPASEFLFEPEFPVTEIVPKAQQGASKRARSLSVLPQQGPLFADN